LTSLRFSGERRIEEAASITAAGNRVTDFGIGVEQELRRNIVLVASGRYLRYSPLGPSPASNEWRAATGVKYLLNRRFALKLDYHHDSRDSLDLQHKFVENAVTFGLTLSL
jgi:hypothetical protein